MARRFMPVMAEQVERKYMGVFMRGDAIRKDVYGHDYYEVIPRDCIAQSNSGLGISKREHIMAAEDVFSTVLKNLKKNGYVIMRKQCRHSGSGEYKATIYYLAGE